MHPTSLVDIEHAYVPNFFATPRTAKGVAKVERGYFHDIPIVVVTIFDAANGGILKREVVSPPLPESDLDAARHCVQHTPVGVLAFRRGGEPRIVNRYVRVTPVPPTSTAEKEARRAYYSTAGLEASRPSTIRDEGLRVDSPAVASIITGEGQRVSDERGPE